LFFVMSGSRRTEQGEIMRTAVTTVLGRRHQLATGCPTTTIVLGADDDQIANRLCAQLLLLSAEDPAQRHQSHQLLAAGHALAWRSTTPCG
jgi:hypothetical protein